jgi:hypothetical protein
MHRALHYRFWTCCIRLSPFSIRVRNFACLRDSVSPTCSWAAASFASRGGLAPKIPGRNMPSRGRTVLKALYAPNPGI